MLIQILLGLDLQILIKVFVKIFYTVLTIILIGQIDRIAFDGYVPSAGQEFDLIWNIIDIESVRTMIESAYPVLIRLIIIDSVDPIST